MSIFRPFKKASSLLSKLSVFVVMYAAAEIEQVIAVKMYIHETRHNVFTHRLIVLSQLPFVLDRLIFPVLQYAVATFAPFFRYQNGVFKFYTHISSQF